MAVTVETLDKLERRITLSLAASDLSREVDARLRKLSRTVRADGFRPGKVPMSVVTRRYGDSVQFEVMNDKLGQAFADAANEAKLRVAGLPRITPREASTDGQLQFDAVFEVYPEVAIGDLSAIEIERTASEVTEAAIDRTVDILRKQRRSFSPRPDAEGAAEGDRVTIDFEGKIDGEPFAGGKAEAYPMIIGEGQMLEQFDQAVRGMKVGESKTFALQFPTDYRAKDLAGKEADFLVTVKKAEIQQLPEVDEGFIKSLGIAEGTVEGLRADVKRNLEREVKFRVLARNKAAVLDALLKVATLDVPKALVDGELERMGRSVQEDMKQRGVKEPAPLSPDMIALMRPQAERRVRLGLVIAELVRQNGLQAKPEQLQAHIEELAQSYERPGDVVRWYLSDKQRMGEVEAMVVESNVTAFVQSQAKVVDRTVAFDELMTAA